MSNLFVKRAVSALLASVLLLSASGCSDIDISDKINSRSETSASEVTPEETVSSEEAVSETTAETKSVSEEASSAESSSAESSSSAVSSAAASSAASSATELSFDHAYSGDDVELVGEEAECPYKYSSNSLRNIVRNANTEEYYTDKHLDPEEVYKKIKYTPQMFYGSYLREDLVEEGDNHLSYDLKDYKDYLDSVKWQKMYSYQEEDDVTVSTLPIQIEAGPTSAYGYKLREIKKYNWATLTFAQQEKTDYNEFYRTIDIVGAYYIKDGKFCFTPLKTLEMTGETVKEYSLTDKVYEFDFKFSGGKVTFSNDDGESEMTAKYLNDTSDAYDQTISTASGYVSSKDQIDNIVGFSITAYSSNYKYGDKGKFQVNTYDGDKFYNGTRIYNHYENAAGHFNENGILNFSWADIDGTPHAYEFVYFYGGDSGLVLTDGEKTYFYNFTYSEYAVGAEEEDAKLSSLSEDTLAAIAIKKNSLSDELMKAFEAEGIKVERNEKTGEMMLDSSILFDVDKYDLSSGGKDYLKKFIKAYSSVILKDDYEGFVSKIMVEGHTDSTGERAHNEELSQKRADEVKKYCLSSEVGMDKDAQKEMGDLMEAVGYADDYPVLDEGGLEDKEKSRRVSFKFVIDIDNASKLKLEEPESSDSSAEE